MESFRQPRFSSMENARKTVYSLLTRTRISPWARLHRIMAQRTEARLNTILLRKILRASSLPTSKLQKKADYGYKAGGVSPGKCQLSKFVESTPHPITLSWR